jgi:predicted component of type VI protein secretion system
MLPPFLDRFFGPSGPWSHERELESIRRDVELLLSTQSPAPPASQAAAGRSVDATAARRAERSVRRFGVASWSSLIGVAGFEGNGEKKEMVERAVRAALDAFEPRLRDVRVSVDAEPARREIRIDIRGTMVADPRRAIELETVIRDRQGRELAVRCASQT